MSYSKPKRVIPSAEASQLQRPVFRAFERRPVNYYHDMIMDEDHADLLRAQDSESGARSEQARIAERKRLEEVGRREAKKQFEAGLAEGRESARTDFQRSLELLTEYARVLQAEKREAMDQAERSGIELAFMLAQKIIGRELETKPETVVDIARMALSQVLDCNQIELKVNPEDLDYLRTVQKDIEATLSSQARLELRPDPSRHTGTRHAGDAGHPVHWFGHGAEFQ